MKSCLSTWIYLRDDYAKYSYFTNKVVFNHWTKRFYYQVLIKIWLNQFHKNVAFKVRLVGQVIIKSPSESEFSIWNVETWVERTSWVKRYLFTWYLIYRYYFRHLLVEAWEQTARIFLASS